MSAGCTSNASEIFVDHAFAILTAIHARFEDVSPEELQRRAKAKKYVDAMAYVQSSLDAAMSTR
jgi:hypothetical protein